VIGLVFGVDCPAHVCGHSFALLPVRRRQRGLLFLKGGRGPRPLFLLALGVRLFQLLKAPFGFGFSLVYLGHRLSHRGLGLGGGACDLGSGLSLDIDDLLAHGLILVEFVV